MCIRDRTIASLKWSSSNTDVIEVNDQGVVTAKAYGEATITATTTTEVSYKMCIRDRYNLKEYDYTVVTAKDVQSSLEILNGSGDIFLRNNVDSML